MTHHDEFRDAEWEAYMARQNVSAVKRVLRSPYTFLVALAALCAVPLVALAIFLWG